MSCLELLNDLFIVHSWHICTAAVSPVITIHVGKWQQRTVELDPGSQR